MPKMTPEQIDAFLDEVLIARVATTRPDGRPHVAPVWYLWADGHLYIETARNAVKAKNLRANPNIALTIDTEAGGLRLKYVIVEGTADFIEEREAAHRLMERIYVRYVGVEGLQTPSIQKIFDSDTVIIRVKPQRFITLDSLGPENLSALR